MEDKRTVTHGFTTENESFLFPQKQPDPQSSFVKRRLGRFYKNAAVCAALALGIWALASVNTGFTDSIASGVKEASASELLQDESLGMLEFVSADALPLDGEVVSTFSETGRQVEIRSEPEAEVKSVLSGTVAEIDGNTVTVQNDNGTRSIYTGINADVAAGEYVERSQTIGRLDGEVLALETASGIGYIDSLDEKELTETIE